MRKEKKIAIEKWFEFRDFSFLISKEDILIIRDEVKSWTTEFILSDIKK